MSSTPIRSIVSRITLLTLLGALACGGESSDDPKDPMGGGDGDAQQGDGDGQPGEGNSKDGEYDVCAAVPATAASTALGETVTAEDSILPSTCQYDRSEAGSFVLLQLRIHEGNHVGGSTQNAEDYMETVRGGAGIPEEGKRLVDPVDLKDHDGGFWHVYAYAEDGALEKGGLLELWMRTGNNLVLAQRFFSGDDNHEELAKGMTKLASALADELE